MKATQLEAILTILLICLGVSARGNDTIHLTMENGRAFIVNSATKEIKLSAPPVRSGQSFPKFEPFTLALDYTDLTRVPENRFVVAHSATEFVLISQWGKFKRFKRTDFPNLWMLDNMPLPDLETFSWKVGATEFLEVRLWNRARSTEMTLLVFSSNGRFFQGKVDHDDEDQQEVVGPYLYYPWEGKAFSTETFRLVPFNDRTRDSVNARLVRTQPISDFTGSVGKRYVRCGPKRITLPTLPELIGPSPEFWQSSFQYSGRTHTIYTVAYLSPHGTKTGETYVFRDDRRWVLVDYDYHPSLEFSVLPSGILEFPTFIRRKEIDLDRFDAEADFIPRVSKRRVVDAEGELIIDVLEYVESYSPDLVSEYRQTHAPVGYSPNAKMASILEEIRAGLRRKTAGSIVILGESGSGKTETLRTFAQAVAAGYFPDIPRTLKVFVTSHLSMDSGSKWVGTTEAKVLALLEASETVPALVMIDELPTIAGTGVSDGRPTSFLDMVLPELSNGTFKLLGTATEATFYRTFGSNEPVLRRFTPVTMTVQSASETIAIAKQWIEKNRVRKFSGDLLEHCYRRSEEFARTGAQPSRIISLIDYINTRSASNQPMSAEGIDPLIGQFYRVPAVFLDPALRQQALRALPDFLETQIAGTSDYKNALMEQAIIGFSGLADPTKPLGRVLVAGGPGTAKTEGAKLLAKHFGIAFHRFEMARFPYGSGERFMLELGNAIKQSSFSVVLLDEFESASSDVMDALLRTMDSATFALPKQTSRGYEPSETMVDARGVIFVAATNAGESWLRGHLHDEGKVGLVKHSPSSSTQVRRKFEQALSDEGISKRIQSRFPNIVWTEFPTKEQFARVVGIHLKKFEDELSERQRIYLKVADRPAVVQYFVEKYFDERLGYRQVHQAIQEIRLSIGELSKGEHSRKLHLSVAPDGCAVMVARESSK